MKEYNMKIEGMMCAGCENRVQNALKTIEGVEEVVANHTDGSVKVTAKETVTEESIKEKIEDIGYTIVG